MKGLFVTGTDTGIGKTVISAALARVLRHRRRVLYWKPVQTGIEQDDDTAEVVRLAELSAAEVHDKGIRLKRPFSPHLSARLADTQFEISDVLDHAPPERDQFLIVEGAGGLLVPLNESELMIDLVSKLDLPAVIVSRTGLGTINHTLLSIEALMRRGIEIAGVIMNGIPNPENTRAIAEYGNVAILAEIPLIDPLNPEDLRKAVERVRISL